jgi:prefoldin alpha subunit
VSVEEETFRRLAVELRLLEGTADALQSRINLVNATLADYRVSSVTLVGVEKEKQGAPLLVGIGGGTYINTKLGNAEKVIMGIGAGVAIEKTIAEAKENVDNRIDELGKTRNSLDQQLTQVMEKIQENRTRLEELTSKLRDGESTRRV